MTELFDHIDSGACEKNDSWIHASHIEQYRKPREVWIERGHVFVESYDGAIVSMTPESALELSRLIGKTGAESLVHKVMDEVASRSRDPKTLLNE